MNFRFSASKRDILKSLSEGRKIEVDGAIDNGEDPDYGYTDIIIMKFREARPTKAEPKKTHIISGRAFLLNGVREFSGYSSRNRHSVVLHNR